MSGKRLVSSKFLKTSVLLKNKQLIRHIPPQERFSMNVLRKMLERYQVVYIKPVHGFKGIGIMRAEITGKRYELRSGTSTAVFTSVQGLYQSIRGRIHNKSYLVQRGIRTLLHDGRPFDFRIMAQMNEQRKWEVSGIVGRVAQPRRIVTNRSQGGKCMPAHTLLRPYMSESQCKAYLASLFQLSRAIGRQFHRSYPAARQLGIDIAISQDQKPWVLEVNTNPAITPFVVLGDKRMHSRIVQLRKLNRVQSKS